MEELSVNSTISDFIVDGIFMRHSLFFRLIAEIRSRYGSYIASTYREGLNMKEAKAYVTRMVKKNSELENELLKCGDTLRKRVPKTDTVECKEKIKTLKEEICYLRKYSQRDYVDMIPTYITKIRRKKIIKDIRDTFLKDNAYADGTLSEMDMDSIDHLAIHFVGHVMATLCFHDIEGGVVECVNLTHTTDINML